MCSLVLGEGVGQVERETPRVRRQRSRPEGAADPDAPPRLEGQPPERRVGAIEAPEVLPLVAHPVHLDPHPAMDRGPGRPGGEVPGVPGNGDPGPPLPEHSGQSPPRSDLRSLPEHPEGRLVELEDDQAPGGGRGHRGGSLATPGQLPLAPRGRPGWFHPLGPKRSAGAVEEDGWDR